MRTEKVIAYIDGFNLYFGLKDKGWQRYYWLSIKLLCQKLLGVIPNPHYLVLVKYFTSRIKKPEDKRRRQSLYIDALNTVGGIKPYYGKYQLSPLTCEKCGYKDEIPEEKMTDVQLASQMILDVYENRYDTALLVSGDIDLVPCIEVIRSKFPNKKVVVAFPPLRQSDELRRVAHRCIHVTEDILKESLMPQQIPTTGGYLLECPDEWR